MNRINWILKIFSCLQLLMNDMGEIFLESGDKLELKSKDWTLGDCKHTSDKNSFWPKSWDKTNVGQDNMLSLCAIARLWHVKGKKHWVCHTNDAVYKEYNLNLFSQIWVPTLREANKVVLWKTKKIRFLLCSLDFFMEMILSRMQSI